MRQMPLNWIEQAEARQVLVAANSERPSAVDRIGGAGWLQWARTWLAAGNDGNRAEIMR